jgi:hypothetical protein
MSACPNCKAALTCGCQKRVAANGQACCSNCVVKYNADISAKKTITVTPAPKSPSSVKAIYKGPGQQTK